MDLELEDEFDSLHGDLSEVQKEIVPCIAGFVRQRLSAKIKCDDCLSLFNANAENFSLIVLKDKGGLVYPNKDTVKICEIAEQKIIEIMHQNKLFGSKNILQNLVTKIMSCVITQYPWVYCQCNEHDAGHRYNFIRQIAVSYCIIRLQYLAKEKNREMKQKKIRKVYTKLVLFNGQ